MTILVTGAAGFIGSSVSSALLRRGDRVIGIDNLNSYYDPKLKQWRRERLEAHDGFSFRRIDISDRAAMQELSDELADEITGIIHLAAQAGVRHSLTHPFDYTDANVTGHLTILEMARRTKNLRHLVYASSSSVYGGNTKLPFSVEDRVDTPISLYAATKRANELMGHTYSHLYGIPASGLRFFTVYGPAGRPDMAAYIFAWQIMAGEPITVFNHGDMERDFTFIDDIVAGVIGCLDTPPSRDGTPHRLYNLGNNRSESLMRYVSLIEEALGRKAIIEFAPMQPGDVRATYADIEAAKRDFGFLPQTPIEVGIPRFIAWFREYHGL